MKINWKTAWIPALTVGLYVANYYLGVAKDPETIMWLGATVTILHYLLPPTKVSAGSVSESSTPNKQTES